MLLRETSAAYFIELKPRKDIVSCYKRKGFKNMQNQLKVIACAFLISFSCAVYAKSSAVILRNSLLATINAIGKEVGFFERNLERTGSIPNNSVFATTTASFVQRVVHYPSNNLGSYGFIIYNLNDANPRLNSTRFIFHYAANGGELVTPIECYYYPRNANINLESVRLGPGQSSNVNLFTFSENTIMQGCISV